MQQGGLCFGSPFPPLEHSPCLLRSPPVLLLCICWLEKRPPEREALWFTWEREINPAACGDLQLEAINPSVRRNSCLCCWSERWTDQSPCWSWCINKALCQPH